MNYKPTPVDTSGIKLGPEIMKLMEVLAENTHDVWARQRMSEGWRYGPRRDDGKKQHPSLVPYADLSESEKEYDRQTALETLKVIVALGYRISKD